jgi:predicted phosphate transport protein (TIGR00153 family)
MSILFKQVKQLVLEVDEFISTVEQGVLIFKQGVYNYLDKDKKQFYDKIKNIERLEAQADKLQRNIDKELYLHSILPQHASDIEELIDKLDEIIDRSKESLYEFDVEIPYIPDELIRDFKRLTDVSTEAAMAVFPAVSTFFTEPSKVKAMLPKVYFYEKESDKLSRNIKRRLFHEMDNLKLSQKIHLRYFALHIETISDKAENLADFLSINALKFNL